jgi:hypothetical protein
MYIVFRVDTVCCYICTYLLVSRDVCCLYLVWRLRRQGGRAPCQGLAGSPHHIFIVQKFYATLSVSYLGKGRGTSGTSMVDTILGSLVEISTGLGYTEFYRVLTFMKIIHNSRSSFYRNTQDRVHRAAQVILNKF